MVVLLPPPLLDGRRSGIERMRRPR